MFSNKNKYNHYYLNSDSSVDTKGYKSNYHEPIVMCETIAFLFITGFLVLSNE